MYLQCTGQVYGGYIIHFLAMYLQCIGPVHHPLPPVSRGLDSSFVLFLEYDQFCLWIDKIRGEDKIKENDKKKIRKNDGNRKVVNDLVVKKRGVVTITWLHQKNKKREWSLALLESNVQLASYTGSATTLGGNIKI